MLCCLQSYTCRFFNLFSLSTNILGSALYCSPMKSDELLHWLRSYDLPYAVLPAHQELGHKSQFYFSHSSLNSSCRCSAYFTAELVTAIIVEGVPACGRSLYCAMTNLFHPLDSTKRPRVGVC